MSLPYKSFPFYHKLAAVLVSLIAIGYLVIQGKELLSPLIFSCLFLMSYFLQGFASMTPVSDDQNKAQASDNVPAQKNNQDNQ